MDLSREVHVTYVEMVRSHVERCLQDMWDKCRVEVDADGDYPFRYGTAACFVRVEESAGLVTVRVFAQAAHGVPRSMKVLTEINDVNRRTRTAHAYWDAGMVLVEQSVGASGVDRQTLDQACRSVGQVADDIGGMIAAVYGGQTPFGALSEAVDGAGE